MNPNELKVSDTNTSLSVLPLLFYGIFFALIGLVVYFLGFFLQIAHVVFNRNMYLVGDGFLWLSGFPLVLGTIMAAIDLFVLLPQKRAGRSVVNVPLTSSNMTVVLTAYNDEESIGPTVEDFKKHPAVKRVIVVSNNSSDATLTRAQEAGAIVFNEVNPGYGRCVYRCFQEGVKQVDTDLILLCEGDMTFRAHDIDKFLAYIPHATIVNGTRIVEQLRECKTQLSTFMYYGNFFVGKLLEAKHLGKGTFTDVGTTYKLCRKDALLRLLPHLDASVNLEFNAYFMDTALKRNEILVECPITFYPRVGKSKGGNVNNRRALSVGSKMIFGLLFGFKKKEKFLSTH
jgi:glycosyltransferase involved in cell wall biosynthesis